MKVRKIVKILNREIFGKLMIKAKISSRRNKMINKVKKNSKKNREIKMTNICKKKMCLMKRIIIVKIMIVNKSMMNNCKDNEYNKMTNDRRIVSLRILILKMMSIIRKTSMWRNKEKKSISMIFQKSFKMMKKTKKE